MEIVEEKRQLRVWGEGTLGIQFVDHDQDSLRITAVREGLVGAMSGLKVNDIVVKVGDVGNLQAKDFSALTTQRPVMVSVVRNVRKSLKRIKNEQEQAERDRKKAKKQAKKQVDSRLVRLEQAVRDRKKAAKEEQAERNRRYAEERDRRMAEKPAKKAEEKAERDRRMFEVLAEMAEDEKVEKDRKKAEEAKKYAVLADVRAKLDAKIAEAPPTLSDEEVAKREADIKSQWEEEFDKDQPETDRNRNLCLLVCEKADLKERVRKSKQLHRCSQIMEEGGPNTLFKAADVGIVLDIETLAETGYFYSQSLFTVQTKKRTFSRKRTRLGGKLEMPVLTPDFDAFQQNADIAAIADRLSKLGKEGSDKWTYRTNVHQLLRFCDKLPDGVFLDLAQVMSDMLTLVCITGGSIGDLLEMVIQGARARFKAAGRESYMKQFDDPAFCQFVATIMNQRGVDIGTVLEYSRECGIQFLFKAILTGLLVEDALPLLRDVIADPDEPDIERVDNGKKAKTAARAKCQFGEFTNALQMFGIDGNDYRDVEEYKFQSIMRTHRERIAVNRWKERRMPGDKVERSQVEIDYKDGEPKFLEIDAFTWVPRRDGSLLKVFDSGENDLKMKVDAFYNDYVYKAGEEYTKDPGQNWWNAMSGNVSLLWGYAWKWAVSVGARTVVLRKGEFCE